MAIVYRIYKLIRNLNEVEEFLNRCADDGWRIAGVNNKFVILKKIIKR
jgi:hypothetical protein